MKAPRKPKKQRMGRPLENIPLRKLVKDVKRDIQAKLKRD